MVWIDSISRSEFSRAKTTNWQPKSRANSTPAALVTDIVSGGEGSELYRVELPEEYVDLDIDRLSARMRRDHGATLLAVTRDGHTLANPPSDFRLRRDNCVHIPLKRRDGVCIAGTFH